MRRISTLALPLLLMALLLGACGGDDNGDDGATATTTTSPSDSTASPTATSEGDSTPGGSSDDGTGADAAPDLSALAQEFSTATFTATYRVTGSTDGEAMDGEWRWYQDGSERLRMDFTAMGELGTMISTPDGLVICAEGVCFSLSGDAAGPLPNMGAVLTDQVDDIQAEAVTGEVRAVGSRDIAGVQAECYEFEDAEAGAEGTACYAEGGIPVLIESTGDDGDFRMEAIEFDDSVSDEDFEPPYPVTGLPTGN